MKKIPTSGAPGVPSLRKKKAAALLLTALLLIGSLAGCGKQNAQGNDASADGSLKKVTLNEVAHSIFYAPMYVAIEEGYFEEEGIELTLITGFGADKTMTAVLTWPSLSCACDLHIRSIVVITIVTGATP